MSKLKTLTWADFDKFSPCYSPAEQYGKFNGTILDILKDERIPAVDKIWAATREEILDDKTLRLFACKCAREVWHMLTDERSQNAVEVAERYAVGGATDSELAAACDAAWVAAGAAACDAAWVAACDATWVAARAAAWATWAAAGAATWVAAGVAARAAARDKQVEILINLIDT